MKRMVYIIRPIVPVEQDGEVDPTAKLRMEYADALTDEEGNRLELASYGEAKAEAERRGFDFRNVSRAEATRQVKS